VELTVDPGAVTRRRRLLRRFLAVYLGGTLLCLGLLAWAVAAGNPVAVVLAGLSALQVGFYTTLIVVRLLRRDPTRLRVGPDGFDDGPGTVPWADVRSVRVRRDAVPRLVVVLRKGSRLHEAWLYGRPLDDIVAAFGRYTTPVDPHGPRPPVEDEEAGTVTFFFVPWQLRALRLAYLRRCAQVPLMVLPALAGLTALGYWYLAGPFAVGLVVSVILWCDKARYHHRLLRVTRKGRGRLLLGPDSVTLPGTDVAVAWAHVHEVRTDPAAGRVHAVFTCRDGRPECPWANRTVPFRVDAGSYHTTLDRLAEAFGRHVTVHSGQ
jgi:hypothetical protein